LTKDHPWKYVPTSSNPADLKSRLTPATEFQNNKLWLKGPDWITDKGLWPIWRTTHSTSIILSTVSADVDSRSDETDFNQNPEGPNISKLIEILRFSSYQKLLRVTVYVTRFIQNCKTERKNKNKGHLSPDEMNEAAMKWIFSIEQDMFHEEIKNLKAHKQNQLIKQLRLFLDDKEIIRCGGRIHKSYPLTFKTYIYKSSDFGCPHQHIFTLDAEEPSHVCLRNSGFLASDKL
jgi:hypothetical protein